MPGRTTIRSAWTMLLVGLVLSALAGVATAATDWLATCSKCISPLVFSKTGIGTSNAVAEARVTQAAVAEWCGSWQPDNKLCVKQQMAAEDLKTVYRASANCSAGSITPVDGQTYRMAGVWEKGEIGAGRSKWRDSTGMIVPRDNASGGLGISQQWELLCPAGSKNAKATPAAAKAAVAAAAPAQPGFAPPVDEFAVGRAVLARYGSEWVRGRINAIRHLTGANGPVTAYEVTLDNGKRGMVTERMLRKAP